MIFDKVKDKNIEKVPDLPTDGWMIISVNEFYQRDNKKYRWLHGQHAYGRIGYSILIFHIKSKDFEKKHFEQ